MNHPAIIRKWNRMYCWPPDLTQVATVDAPVAAETEEMSIAFEAAEW